MPKLTSADVQGDEATAAWYNPFEQLDLYQIISLL